MQAAAATAAAAEEHLLPREQAMSILSAYLENARFANVRINKGYLVSLGLSVP